MSQAGADGWPGGAFANPVIGGFYPDLYRIGDFWYLLIAEGGTDRGHGVSVARSLSPDGPFESCPANPVLTHRSTSRPVQNTGHADLVQAPDGSWWMVLLGVRPRGGTPGWLTLHARGASLDDPDVTFAGRRQQHLPCRVRVLADASVGRGELAVRLDERRHYAVELGDGQVRVVARIGPLRQTVASRPAPAGAAVLRVEARASPPGLDHPLREPDMLRLGVEEPDGSFSVLAELDGRYLPTEVAGGFTGRVIGMYPAAGTIRYDWFNYEPLGD